MGGEIAVVFGYAGVEFDDVVSCVKLVDEIAKDVAEGRLHG